MAEVTPVHLCLFARQGAQTQIGFGLRTRPMAGDEVAEVIGAAGIAAFAHHSIQAARRQRRECLKRLADEGQVRVDQRSARRRADQWQTSLRQHAADHAVMHVQLTGDRAHRPLLDVVIAQDLSFDIRRCHHGRVPSGPVVASLDGDRGDAKSLGGRGSDTAARTNGSARPAAEAAHPGLSRRSQSSASRAAQDHQVAMEVNRDASLFRFARDIGVPARHARAARDGWSGNARRRHAGCRVGHVRRSRRHSRSGRGRSNCRSTPGRGIPRR